MKNIIIYTDFSTSYCKTILYAFKLLRGQNCNFLILNLPREESFGALNPHEKAKKECLYFNTLERLHQLQKKINHYFPEENFNLQSLSLHDFREQSHNISLIIAGSSMLVKWKGKILLDIFRRNLIPLLVIPDDLNFNYPKKVLVSLEPNLDIKQGALAPFKKFFGHYKMDLELFKIYADRNNPALEARDEFELTQLYDAYHPKVRKTYTRQIEGALKMNLKKEKIDFHIVPLTRTTGNSILYSSGFQKSISRSYVPLMIIRGSEVQEPFHFTRSSRTRTKTAFFL